MCAHTAYFFYFLTERSSNLFSPCKKKHSQLDIFYLVYYFYYYSVYKLKYVLQLHWLFAGFVCVSVIR